MTADIEKLKDWHARLAAARDDLIGLVNEGFPEGLSTATVFALGEATGTLAKAKALIGRDIDDAEREPGA